MRLIFMMTSPFNKIADSNETCSYLLKKMLKELKIIKILEPFTKV